MPSLRILAVAAVFAVLTLEVAASGPVVFNVTVTGGSSTNANNPNLLDDGVVYHVTADHLVALNAQSGAVMWRAYPPWQPASSLVVIGGNVIVQSAKGAIMAFNYQSGRRAWHVPNEHANLVANTFALGYFSSTVSEVFQVLTLSYPQRGATLRAFTAASGKLVWNTTLTTNGAAAKPLYYNAMVFTAVDGGVYINDINDGSLVHHHTSTCFGASNGLWAFITDNQLVFSTVNGFAVAPISGFHTLTNCSFINGDFEQQVNGAVLLNNTVTTSSFKGVNAFDARTGESLWWRNFEVSRTMVPFDSSRIVVGVKDTGLVLLRVRSGITDSVFSTGIPGSFPMGLTTQGGGQTVFSDGDNVMCHN